MRRICLFAALAAAALSAELDVIGGFSSDVQGTRILVSNDSGAAFSLRVEEVVPGSGSNPDTTNNLTSSTVATGFQAVTIGDFNNQRYEIIANRDSNGGELFRAGVTVTGSINDNQARNNLRDDINGLATFTAITSGEAILISTTGPAYGLTVQTSLTPADLTTATVNATPTTRVQRVVGPDSPMDVGDDWTLDLGATSGAMDIARKQHNVGATDDFGDVAEGLRDAVNSDSSINAAFDAFVEDDELILVRESATAFFSTLFVELDGETGALLQAKRAAFSGSVYEDDVWTLNIPEAGTPPDASVQVGSSESLSAVVADLRGDLDGSSEFIAVSDGNNAFTVMRTFRGQGLD